MTPEMNEDALVAPDGTIGIRAAGQVRASGLTAEELTEEVAQASRRVLTTPIVTVSVVDPAAAVIYVGGSVRRPGAYSLSSHPGVFESIAVAGGLEPEARADEVVLIRRSPLNQPMLRTVNLQAFISNASTPGDVPVMPGDIIFVPRNRISEVDLWIDQFINRFVPFSRGFSYTVNRNLPGAAF